MVTLAVPVCNMERWLARCIDSLLHQTCRDYEILLIDDGSTDSSSALCDSYAAAHPELVRVVHKPNGGLSTARNAGIDNARGEFIIFPDPDDWVEPGYVQALMERQQSFQTDMVVLGHYVDTEHRCVPARADAPMQLFTGREAQRSLLLPPKMQGFSWIKLYRLDLIRSHELYFQKGLGTTEDLDFAYRYLAHCQRVCYDPSCRVYHYFQWEGSTTRSVFSADKLGTMRTYEYIIADCAERDPELAQQARAEICTCAVNLLWENESSEGPDPQVQRELRRRILHLLPGYLFKSRYSFGRKLQALLAAGSPRLYRHLKNAIRSISKK